MMALGAIPSPHPLFMGMIGMHGSAAVAKALGEADAIIALGARFSDRVAGNPNKFAHNAKIVHIDADAAEVDKVVRSAAHIISDLCPALDYLLGAVKRKSNKAWSERCRELRKIHTLRDSDKPLCPRKLIRGIAAASPDNRIVTTDVGQHQMWTAQTVHIERPRTWLTSGGLGTMGFGMGAAIGAACGTGKRVVLVTGDGSFHMNMNELMTAARLRLPITVLLFNNHTLGMVRQWQTLFYGKRYSSTTLDLPTDYVKLAEALGAESMVLDKNADIDAVLKKALSRPNPVLVDCRLARDEMVLPMIPPGKGMDDMITDLNEL